MKHGNQRELERVPMSCSPAEQAKALDTLAATLDSYIDKYDSFDETFTKEQIAAVNAHEAQLYTLLRSTRDLARRLKNK